MFVLLMILLGFIGSFFSGLLGIGGAIINYPLLLFIPPLMGLDGFTAHEVASISIFQVFFSSLSGIVGYGMQSRKSKKGLIHLPLAAWMGTSILIGSLVGGIWSSQFEEQTINIIYGLLAVLAVVLMLLPVKGRDEKRDIQEVEFNRFLASSSAFATGIVSGIVGAGGGFILIPIMLKLLRIPVRITIATSLTIVFISAIGGVIGKINGGDIPLIPIILAVIGSVAGSPVGSLVSSKMNVKYLRYALVLLITLTAIKIWSSII
ncbi:sulfite exporter TauE/SafE family protein [Paenibacillus sp. Marseille-Q4541]|uniref:sulfite exporter TauE/SafE family protein n=1 Tax=Paenibacillus sp. Marseille-Q4541 TaxID=2831522 RepID=UPI00201A18FB|nr:sulfite exporter TauE/SafE family protein [Paenibacillus sp. Marseille-Q4541]